MLAFRTRSGGVPVVPACLDGWVPRGDYCLAHRDIGDGDHMVGVAHSVVFDAPSAWADLGEGWSVAHTPGAIFNPSALARGQLWFDTAIVRDLHDRAWVAPVIRTHDGKRAFRVAYGRDWLPALTPAQERCEAIADEILNALATGECPMAVACQWSAELLSVANHITPEVIGALGLLDDSLVFSTLAAAVSREIGRAD